MPRRPRHRGVLPATGLVVTLALASTACGGSADDKANAGQPGAGTSRAADGDADNAKAPSDNTDIADIADITDRLEKHGIDVDRWKDDGRQDRDENK